MTNRPALAAEQPPADTMSDEFIRQQWMNALGCPTSSSNAPDYVLAFARALIAAEREACARACESLGPVSTYSPMACAAAIRARKGTSNG